jgi:hypothetical protein
MQANKAAIALLGLFLLAGAVRCQPLAGGRALTILDPAGSMLQISSMSRCQV